MKSKISIWQLIIVLFTICILGLSALPTIYGKNDAILIQSNTESNTLPSAADFSKLLKQHNIAVNKIENNDQGVAIVLAHENLHSQQDSGIRSDKVKAIISSWLGENYHVRTDELSASPVWLDSLGFSPIKLGLDLYGGVLFVIHVDSEVARAENTQSTKDEIKTFIRKSRLRGAVPSITAAHNLQIKLDQRAKTDNSWPAIKTFIQTQFPHFDIIKLNENSFELKWTEQEITQFRQELMQQSLSIMRKRIESLGISEAAIQRQGKEYIRIELPGVKDPEQAKEIIGTTATLDIYAMAKAGASRHVFTNKQGLALAVEKPSVFGGVNIKSAFAGTDEMGLPLVNLVLDQQGGEKMSQFSKANIGQAMVTVFSQYNKDASGKLQKESEVINVATVITQLGNRFSITNMESPQAAQKLAVLIRAGSLNAPLSIVEQRTINPSLGKENVANGFAALALGVGLTMLFMALWYRKLGLIANISLVINLICLLGLMAMLPGMVLTLPGIAGLVLTVGMAVDTNVLVFERIKEEVSKTRQSLHAIEVGYKRAFTTILDANITTMICALILMGMGNGPVRGFAMTLCLGLLTSLFSGVFVARLLTQFFPAHTLVKQKELAK